MISLHSIGLAIGLVFALGFAYNEDPPAAIFALIVAVVVYWVILPKNKELEQDDD